MKIGLVSSVVPLVKGGYRHIVEWLAPELEKAGHQIETVWLPFVDEPDRLLPQMTAYRLLRLEDSFDRIITFRPPAHLVRHPIKIVWFLHHLRAFYDAWGTPYCPVPDRPRWRGLRARLFNADTIALNEAAAVFSNSRLVSQRLRRFNGVESQVLYPPVTRPERFYTETWGGELAFICRIEHHKRQHLAIEAMRHVKTPVRLRICGASLSPDYVAHLRRSIIDGNLENRVTLDVRWISEGEKLSLLSTALANVYLAIDEDSYGYPTLEAAHARKATVAALDGGAIDEFVVDGETGLMVAPEPQALADAFDRLWSDRALARRLGSRANAQIDAAGIRWSNVVNALTACETGRKAAAFV